MTGAGAALFQFNVTPRFSLFAASARLRIERRWGGDAGWGQARGEAEEEKPARASPALNSRQQHGATARGRATASQTGCAVFLGARTFVVLMRKTLVVFDDMN